MEIEDEAPQASNGAWREWKRSFAGFAESVVSLASLRWDMAKSEAREWGRAALIRVLLFAAAAILAGLSLVLFVVGLVLILELLLGSLIAAVFASFALCALGAGALVFAGTRGRTSRPIFQRTAAEVRKDFEAWAGEDAREDAREGGAQEGDREGGAWEGAPEER